MGLEQTRPHWVDRGLDQKSIKEWSNELMNLNLDLFEKKGCICMSMTMEKLE